MSNQHWFHLVLAGRHPLPIALALFVGAAAAGAQPVPSPALRAAPSAAPRPAVMDLIDVQADSLSYDSARQVVIARGNARITRGTDSIAADYAEVDTASGQVYGRGNLVIEYSGSIWKGEEAHYNLKTGVGDFGDFEAYSPPYHLTARDSRRLSPRVVELDGILMTTCEPDSPEYSVRASSATLEDNKILRAKNVRFQFGPVPFFYLPYLRANLEELAKFEITPGWSSRMGPFILTAYNQPLNDVFRSRTHVDLRQKRGVGLGQDFLWKDPDRTFEGWVRAYYTRDRYLYHNDADRREREGFIEEDRYWLQLRDTRSLTDRDYLITEVNYVSDYWMLSDFFDDEYQNNVQPENRITLSHRGDNFTVGVGLNTRLNDFYGNVNRLPEVFLNFNRQQILETPFFYEGANTLSYLERVFPETTDAESYDAFRFDSQNMVYWPTRHFGFLSLIPRAGYQGTYFSKTIETYSETNRVPGTNSLGEAVIEDVVSTITRDGPAVWRSLPEIGLETSFKAFGELYRGPTGIHEDMDLRHVAEPYANYTLRFEPNALPEELWQFDSIDTLNERNDLLLGMRNYLQTRRGANPHDLIYSDVFTTLQMDPDENQDTLSLIGFRTELKPVKWFRWDFDGAYDTQDGSLTNFNTQAELAVDDLYRLSLEYRYRRELSEMVATDLTLFPEQRWSFRAYVRMDLEDSHVEEHSYYIVHRTRCLGIGLGIRIRPDRSEEEDDSYTGWVRVWPLALPGFLNAIGG